MFKIIENPGVIMFWQFIMLQCRYDLPQVTQYSLYLVSRLGIRFTSRVAEQLKTLRNFRKVSKLGGDIVQ